MQLLYKNISLLKKQSIDWTSYLQEIPKEEQHRIMRLRQKSDRILATEGIKLVQSMSGDLTDFKRTEYGKPYFKDKQNYFNISHAGDIVICAFSENQNLGIDIEKKEEVTIGDFHLMMRPEEIDETRNLHDFYSLWTQKEALIKAIGKGFSIDVKSLEITTDYCIHSEKKWKLKEIEISPEYTCHIAFQEEEELIIKQIDEKTVLNESN